MGSKKKINNPEVIRVFSARACAKPLKEAAELFTNETGIKVEISVCSRHCASIEAEEAKGGKGGDDFLHEIEDAGIHDLAIGGAEYLLDDGEVRGIIQKKERRSIALRKSAILVPERNPQNIGNLTDLTRPGVRIGVSVLDCLKGCWEDICGRAGIMEAVRENITFYANGCIAIIEAVAQEKVDAAFGWTSFIHLEPKRIRIVPLHEEQSIFRGTGIGLLRFSKNPEAAKRFMDFLITPRSRDMYKKFGWEVR